jgi:hypothetical protein
MLYVNYGFIICKKSRGEDNKAAEMWHAKVKIFVYY